jgi:NTE family protein
VLDKLFEDGRIAIKAISGTSAGAMNAVAAADGLMRAGNDGAREALERFWAAISRRAMGSPIRRMAFDKLIGNWRLDHNPSYHFFDALTRRCRPISSTRST